MNTDNMEKIDLNFGEISDEGVDFEKLDSDSVVIEEPKNSENLSVVNSDDSVKIYLQQIGKIPLLSSEEEHEVARKIKDENCNLSRKRQISLKN